MKRWIWVPIVLVGAGLLAWTQIGAGQPVETATVRPGTVRAMIEELGETRLPRTFVVSMPVEGRLLPIELDEGDSVSAGEVVARVDTLALASLVDQERARIRRLDAEIARNDDERLERSLIDQIELLLVSLDQTVQAAEEQTRASTARLEFARQERRDLEASQEGGAATPLEVLRGKVAETEAEVGEKESFLTLRSTEAVRTAASIGTRFVEQMIELKALDRVALERRREEAAARLTRLEDDLSRAAIRSPVDGVVLARHEESERVLTAGTTLLEIGSLDDLEVRIEMLTDEAGLVREGDRVEIDWAPRRSPIEGVVTRVEPQAFTKISSLGVEQQRVNVIVSMDERAEGMGSDYRVRTRVILEEAAGLSVPRGAVFRVDDAWRAFVVRKGRARLVDVTPGLINDRHVEIAGGLAEGDVVVVAPGLDLKDGSRVRVVRDLTR